MGRPVNFEHPRRAATWIAAFGAAVCLHAGLSHGTEAGPSPLRAPPPQVQRQTLLTSVARMDHGNAAGGDVYFVGFAGYGEQRVFRKEAELAQQVFASRFATGNRSLLLVNDIRDRRSYALATFENLRVV